MMSYRQKHYNIPRTKLGDSFAAIVNNDELLQDRSALVRMVKMVSYHYFRNMNILDNSYTDPERRVRYVEEMRSLPWGYKGPDRMWVEGVTIPLRVSPFSRYSEFDLCIASGNGQMYANEPNVGLRGKLRNGGNWSGITWVKAPTDLLALINLEQLRTGFTFGDFYTECPDDYPAAQILPRLLDDKDRVDWLAAMQGMVKFFTPELKDPKRLLSLEANCIPLERLTDPQRIRALPVASVIAVVEHFRAHSGLEVGALNAHVYKAILDVVETHVPGSYIHHYLKCIK